VTVGLVIHWPCVTDLVVYPPTGSKACMRELSTLPTLSFDYCTLYRDLDLDLYLYECYPNIRDIPVFVEEVPLVPYV